MPITLKTVNKGFTLIELVIVIIILSALGIATSSYIATGVDIYTDISGRDKSLNSVRFVIERLRREVSNALPNSAVVNGSCLTFTPIIASSLYNNSFPISPLSASSAYISPVPDYDFEDGDKAVVYLLNESELTGNKSKAFTINAAKDTITFSATTSYPLSSPARRLYIIRNNITYCFTGSVIKTVTRQDAGADTVLMAEELTGSFTVEDATLQRNSLVQVKFLLDFDGQEAAFEETLHINNVP